MAKVKIDSKAFTKRLVSKFNSFANDKKEMEKAAVVILRNIKADSRDGVGYDGNGFPSLKSSTVERRRKLGEVNNTNRFFAPGTSNATFMGDTINKIAAKFIGGGIIELSGKGNHRKITGVRGKKLEGSDASISDILSGLKKLGYKILGASDKSANSIKKQFIRYIRRK